jgi:hypothetical protein
MSRQRDYQAHYVWTISEGMGSDVGYKNDLISTLPPHPSLPPSSARQRNVRQAPCPTGHFLLGVFDDVPVFLFGTEVIPVVDEFLEPHGGGYQEEPEGEPLFGVGSSENRGGDEDDEGFQPEVEDGFKAGVAAQLVESRKAQQMGGARVEIVFAFAAGFASEGDEEMQQVEGGCSCGKAGDGPILDPCALLYPSVDAK